MTRTTILSALALALLTTSAMAQPHRGGGPPDAHMLRMLESKADEIGLDEATLTRIRTVVGAGEVEANRIRRELQAERKALHALLSVDRPIESAVMQQAEKIGALETAALKQKLQTLLAVRPLLSDAQLAKLRELREGRFATVAAACAQDIAKLCGDVPAGPPRFRCLRRQYDQLSRECRTALSEVRGPRRD